LIVNILYILNYITSSPATKPHKSKSNSSHQMYTEVFNGDYHIRLGKNQQENDNIVRTSSQSALWFHLKDFPSAHAVVTNIVIPGKYDNTVIIRAATLVKDNAKQGVNNLQKVSVNYLPIKNVKRTEILGQVLLTKTPKTIHV